MKTIFKYQLSITDTQFIKMPKGADPFTSYFQGDQLCVWAYVDTEEELEDREFRMFGTGQPIELLGLFRFLNTVHHETGVWHIFAEAKTNG